MIVRTTTSPEETRQVAADLAAALAPPVVVILAGDLGAGKTCFVQGAARALGVTAPVTSPTFVIAREYQGHDLRVIHADAYRLDSLAEVEDLGGEELLCDDALSFVEWGDAVADALPDASVIVEIEVTSETERTIRIQAQDPRLLRRLEAGIGGAA
ncbi:MAG: tRNA (adenosine(37)-N6)-threonylcarbamoyltransferase complex ATPase subunit type 1 TsaE [Actinomycetota bacterium]